jgi:hypothetical protein
VSLIKDFIIFNEFVIEDTVGRRFQYCQCPL